MIKKLLKPRKVSVEKQKFIMYGKRKIFEIFFKLKYENQNLYESSKFILNVISNFLYIYYNYYLLKHGSS